MPPLSPPPLRLTGTTGPPGIPGIALPVGERVTADAFPGALPGLPRRPLTPDQRADALRRVQEQADQRLKLGLQLFKAAEAQATQHHAVLDSVKQEQAQLRQDIREDVARSLRDYDQWVGALEKRLLERMDDHARRLEELENNWAGVEQRMETMLRRAEAMLDQTRCLLMGTTRPTSQVPNIAPAAPEVPVEGDATDTPSALFSEIMDRLNAGQSPASGKV